jgi:hypothetical protein
MWIKGGKGHDFLVKGGCCTYYLSGLLAFAMEAMERKELKLYDENKMG